MANAEFRIFLSAVSSEFRSARNELTDDFGARDVLVRVQEQFVPGRRPHTLLAALDEYIRGCTTVICVIGRRSGACPTPEEAAPFAHMLPNGVTQASYTQWEYFLARHYDKECLLFLAQDDYEPDEATQHGDNFPDLQRDFVERIKRSGLHYEGFATTDALCRAVGRHRWPERTATPSAATHKPIVLPYPSLGTLFKGRDAFLRRLRGSLTQPTGMAAIAVSAVHGLGGVGKTRAAVEYAWKYRADYAALFLIEGDSPAKLQSSLATLVGPLLLVEHETATEAVRMEAVLAWLNTNPSWLLILDNVDTITALDAANRLMGRLSGGHLVLTSRLGRFVHGVEKLDLDVLDVAEAAAFLVEATMTERRNAVDDEEHARRLAGELGGLALALEMAAATIAVRGLSIAAYREIWQGNRARVVGWASHMISGYHNAMAETWQTSVDQLTEAGRHLLERLAFLAPDPVPEFLLQVPVPGVQGEDAVDALVDLAAYSLVTRNLVGETFGVHQLMQDVTRRGLADATLTHVRLSQALGWVNAGFTSDPLDVGSWARLDPLMSHAVVVAQHADAAGIAAPTERLMKELALHFRRRSLGQAKAKKLAESLLNYPPPKPHEWTTQTVRERIELADALYEGGRLTSEEHLFYSVNPVETIHHNWCTDGHYDPDLKPISDRMSEIEREHGLSDNQYWSLEDAPEEYRRLSDSYDAVMDMKFEAALREFGLQAHADLWRGNRIEYDRKREVGRLSVFGPLDIEAASVRK